MQSENSELDHVAAPKVFVCILNWNKPEVTLQCLRAVQSQDYANFRVVIVDNGSTDGSVAAFRALGDTIDLVEIKENIGFTGGANAGLRYVLVQGGDYVWLLNNDCECGPGTLRRLVQYAEEHSDIGMVSPIITDRRSGEDSYAVGRIDLASGITDQTADAAKAEVMQARYRSQIMLKGTALLLKRSVIERVGFFDEQLFMYCEDNDYAVRSVAKGFGAACVTTERVYHDEGRPGGGWREPYAYFYSVRNGILFWRKYGRGLLSWKAARWHICTMFRVLARSGYGKAETEAFADGLWAGLLCRTGRWDPSSPSHRMPFVLRHVFVYMPALSLGLIELNPKAILAVLYQVIVGVICRRIPKGGEI